MAKLTRFQELLAQVNDEYLCLWAKNAALSEQHALLYKIVNEQAAGGAAVSLPALPSARCDAQSSSRESENLISPRNLCSTGLGLPDADDNASDHSPAVPREREKEDTGRLLQPMQQSGRGDDHHHQEQYPPNHRVEAQRDDKTLPGLASIRAAQQPSLPDEEENHLERLPVMFPVRSTASASTSRFSQRLSSLRGEAPFSANASQRSAFMSSLGSMKSMASMKSMGSMGSMGSMQSLATVHSQGTSLQSTASLDIGHVGVAIEEMFPLWWNPKRELLIQMQSCQAFDDLPNREKSTTFSSGSVCKQKTAGAWVLSPLGMLRLTWDFIGCLLILYDVWATPFDLIFCAEHVIPGMMITSRWILPAFFVLDIILNFNTAYMSERRLICDRRLIAMNYLRFWFWIDSFATIPFDLLFKGGNVRKAFRLLKVFKTMKTICSFTFLSSTKSWQMDDYYMNMRRSSNMRNCLSAVFMCLAMLLLLVHVHCCVWASLQPDIGGATAMPDALKDYFDNFMTIYFALINGVPLHAHTASTQLFAILVATEQAALMVAAVTLAVFETLLRHGDSARTHLLHKQTLKYMQRHGLPLKMQTQVLQGLIEAGSAKAMQKDFINLMESDLPKELQRKIAKDLWGAKLLTLGLLQLVSEWNEDLITSLALLCREDVLASNTILFSEGDASFSAYYIISGEMKVLCPAPSQLVSSPDNILCGPIYMDKMPNFLAGMWLGENALVSPSFRRGLQAISATLVSLMIVPAESFQQLLKEQQVLSRFDRWVQEELWRGLCGRCGRLGDHWSDTCPGKWGSSADSSPLTKRLSIQKTVDNLLTRASARNVTKLTCDQESSDESRAASRELREFLRHWDSEHLLSHLEQMQIYNLSDLEELDVDWLRNELKNQEPAVNLSSRDMAVLSGKQVAKFREKMNQGMSRMMRRQSRGQYLLFLSHYKLEAGTEAALMRSELEQLITEDPDPACDFNVPVFLDSEDLTSLKELQVEVGKSHNLVVLLTTGVLTRPWCLVEMVTAVQHQIPVILVQVTKPGTQFRFPDDQFFKDLTGGKILDQGAMQVLDSVGMDMQVLETTLREIFKSIAVPYSPHRPVHVRQAELKSLIRQCKIREHDNFRKWESARDGVRSTSGCMLLSEKGASGASVMPMANGRTSSMKQSF